MPSNPTPSCPLPGQEACVQARGDFWDEEFQECAADGDETCGPLDATGKIDLEAPCIISFYEDYD